MLEALGGLKLPKAYKASSIWWIARRGVADEPQGEDGHPNFRRRSTRVPEIQRWRSQLRIATRRKTIVILQPQPQEPRKPSANEQAFPRHVLDEPAPRAHVYEITRRGNCIAVRNNQFCLQPSKP
jgi:hypothetical protein